jgi:hypothetical protein
MSSVGRFWFSAWKIVFWVATPAAGVHAQQRGGTAQSLT